MSIPQLNLQEIILRRVNVELNDDFDADVPSAPSLDVSFWSNRHESNASLFRMEARFTIARDSNLVQPYWIDIQTIGFFATVQPMGDDVGPPQELLENALAILYGMVRSTVASLTGMSVGKFLMPTVTFHGAAAGATIMTEDEAANSSERKRRQSARSRKRPTAAASKKK